MKKLITIFVFVFTIAIYSQTNQQLYDIINAVSAQNIQINNFIE